MLTLALKIATVALVHMPVHHVVGIPGFECCVKALESSMRQIVQITHTGGGCMGKQNVAPADHPNLTRQLTHALGHLAFGVHVGAVAITHGPAKASNANPSVRVHAVFHADTSARCMTCVAVIVIAAHVDERFVDDRNQKLKIVRVQIAGGQIRSTPSKRSLRKHSQRHRSSVSAMARIFIGQGLSAHRRAAEWCLPRCPPANSSRQSACSAAEGSLRSVPRRSGCGARRQRG